MGVDMYLWNHNPKKLTRFYYRVIFSYLWKFSAKRKLPRDVNLTKAGFSHRMLILFSPLLSLSSFQTKADTWGSLSGSSKARLLPRGWVRGVAGAPWGSRTARGPSHCPQPGLWSAGAKAQAGAERSLSLQQLPQEGVALTESSPWAPKAGASPQLHYL